MHNTVYRFLMGGILLFAACGERFLDIKPDKSMVVPRTVADFQAILDNTTRMNQSNVPYLGEIGADDLVLSHTDWETLFFEDERNAYIWASDIFGGIQTSFQHWNRAYLAVFYANLAIEGVLESEVSPARDNVLGSGLFYRAWNHFLILNTFSEQYDAENADSNLGIPLRLESDINLPSTRGTVQETYESIIKDLKQAAGLLPDIAIIQTRPSRLSTYALLARVALQTGDYKEALSYADNALAIQSQLLDYNSIDGTLNFPFEQLNKEVIFYTYFYGQPFNTERLQVNSELLEYYGENDLRKDLFFLENNGRVTFRGSYTGSDNLFAGLAVDELYCIKAECLARENRPKDALNTLQKLLTKRFASGKLELPVGNGADEVLGVILKERRKQLLFRGIRWMDLRRLNSDDRFAVTLQRVLKDEVYRLEPGSPRYVLPLPPDVVKLGGLQQNER